MTDRCTIDEMIEEYNFKGYISKIIPTCAEREDHVNISRVDEGYRVHFEDSRITLWVPKELFEIMFEERKP